MANDKPKKSPIGAKLGSTEFKHPEMKRAQAAAIIKRRIQGASMSQVAAEFNISTSTVEKRIDYAKRNGILQLATDQVVNELVPLALSTYVEAIRNGDVKAAKDVLFGTGILSKNNKATVNPTVGPVEMTLAVYREQRKKGYVETADESADAGKVVSGVASIDAEIVGETVDQGYYYHELPLTRPKGWPAPEPDEET